MFPTTTIVSSFYDAMNDRRSFSQIDRQLRSESKGVQEFKQNADLITIYTTKKTIFGSPSEVIIVIHNKSGEVLSIGLRSNGNTEYYKVHPLIEQNPSFFTFLGNDGKLQIYHIEYTDLNLLIGKNVEQTGDCIINIVRINSF